MGQHGCLPIISHQLDIKASHWLWKKQQIEAESENSLENCKNQVLKPFKP